jgi:TonB family protein
MTEWMRVAGWVHLHFLWQCALIALTASVLLQACQDASSRTRYGIACAALGFAIAAPVVTALFIVASATPFPSWAEVQAAAPVLARIQSGPLAGRIETYFPPALAVWLMGAAALLIRTGFGGYRLRMLRRAAFECASSSWQPIVDRLARRLALRTPVRVVEITRAGAPMIIGWLQPVIVVPIAVLAQLTPAHVEAVFAHELAHVRRHDYLINVLQCVAEALLFYHPAIWWLSARVREEREHCCDELAIEVCGDRDTYACALTELESYRAPGPSLGLAATDGPLLRRIRRVLRLPAPARARVEMPASMVTTILVAVFAIVVGGAQETVKPGDPGVTAPTVTFRQMPQYTKAAQDAGIEGTVWLAVLVNADGTVERVRVTESLDAKHGLDDAAAAAVAQWRFRPGRRNGEPVAVETGVHVTFTLSR